MSFDMVRLSAEGGRGNSLNLLESPREMETIAKARSLRNLINRGIFEKFGSSADLSAKGGICG